jgi:hypothetical protein
MPILAALKRLFRRQKIDLPPRAISEEQAMEIARQECERRGWGWYANMIASEHRKQGIWRIHPRGIGGVLLVIDGTTGNIVSAERW